MHIDMEQTGLRLKGAVKAAGYDVKTVQAYLHLSCPQPIYRWFKGKLLPSVDHLLALSILLNVHMEDLLIVQTTDKPVIRRSRSRLVKQRCFLYGRALNQSLDYLSNDKERVFF